MQAKLFCLQTFLGHGMLRNMEIKKCGEKKKIAAWLGIKASYLSNICAGRRRPGAEKAVRLEEISGISCRDWRYLDYNFLAEKILRTFQKQEGGKE